MNTNVDSCFVNTMALLCNCSIELLCYW